MARRTAREATTKANAPPFVLNAVSLCSGVGGLELAAALGCEQAGLPAGVIRTVALCEADDYCRRVLALRFPGVPIFEDIRDVSRESLHERAGIRRVDILYGGIPCQPHSVAGARRGGSDERDLWPETARLVRELRPAWCVVENVPGILSSDAGRFFAAILRDLAALEYRAGWGVWGAADVGAPHQRDRVVILAHRFDRPVADCDQHRRRRPLRAIA